jgi:regulator of cell morphogenesis and NO signaling
MYSKVRQGVKPDDKLSKVIFNNPYILLMLEHFGIGLPVHEKTVSQVCAQSGISLNIFLTISNLYNGIRPTTTPVFDNSDILSIISFLKTSHTYYINEKYPVIREFIEKVQQNNANKEIGLVEKFFNNYFKKVQDHINYENDVAFPYITELIEKGDGQDIGGYSIIEYEEKHDDIEEELVDLKNLLIKYLPLENDQQIRRKLLFALFELEFDLTIHAHIEDLILLPVIKKLEQTA